MLRTSIIMICFYATSFTDVPAQTGYRPAGEPEVKTMQKNIAAASAAMKSLRCEFEQVKTLSILSEDVHSTGFMTYRQPDQVHWEYATPYRYVFAMDGGKVVIESDDNRSEIDVNSSKLFREISAIIVSGINGNDIFNEAKFSVKYMTGAAGYLVILTPKQKEIKQMFHEIRLYFDVKNHTVNVVDILETGGDKTVIRMKNKKVNAAD